MGSRALIGLGLLVVQTVVGGEPLFNGRDLAGWTPVNGGDFTVTNGVLHAEGGKGWLRYERWLTNFVLEVEWRGLEPNYNSGVFIRAPLEGNPWATNVWQINLKQSAIGELLEGSKKQVEVTTPRVPVGEWVKLRVEARDRILSLQINGETAWQYRDFAPISGYVGLQAEGKRCEFRALSLEQLP